MVMFGRRKGNWVRFDLKDPNAKIGLLGTTCISTSAETSSQIHAVVTNGQIKETNDQLREKLQTSQAQREPVPA